MRPDPQAYADVVVLAIKSALAPVLATIKAQQDQIADLQRRVQDDAFTKALGTLGERVAIIETRPLVPGPQGPPGQDGKDGADGKAGLTYQGVFQDGKAYDVGDVTTWGGSSWHCNEATTSKPGDGSKAWTLMVKRGRDGKGAV